MAINASPNFVAHDLVETSRMFYCTPFLISFSTLNHPFIIMPQKEKARTFQFLDGREANVSTGAYLEMHANPLAPKGI